MDPPTPQTVPYTLLNRSSILEDPKIAPPVPDPPRGNRGTSAFMVWGVIDTITMAP